MQHLIEETIRQLRERHGPGEPEVTIEDKTFSVVWRKAPGSEPGPTPPATTEDPRIPEWGRRNPCRFRRFADRIGRAALDRFYAILAGMRAPRPRPRTAMCCSVLNEGPDLERTIESLLAADTVPDTLIFVDDCSRVPISPRVEAALSGRGVRLVQHRQDRRAGPGACRTLAHQLADREESDPETVYLFIDSHMSFPTGWLDGMLKAHAEHPDAVLCTASIGMDGSPFRGAGCRFEGDGAGFIKGTWIAPHPPGECPVVPCIMGACYLAPKRILDAVGGWAPGLVGFGMEEEYLSLRAWACGFEVRCVTGIAVAHRYKREIDRVPAEGSPEQDWEVPYNRHVVASVCFGRETYEKSLREQMLSSLRHDTRTSVEKMLAVKNREIAHLQKVVEISRIRSDKEVLEVTGLVNFP